MGWGNIDQLLLRHSRKPFPGLTAISWQTGGREQRLELKFYDQKGMCRETEKIFTISLWISSSLQKLPREKSRASSRPMMEKPGLLSALRPIFFSSLFKNSNKSLWTASLASVISACRSSTILAHSLSASGESVLASRHL